MEKDISLKSNCRKAGVTILISDKVNMNAKNMTTDKKGYFMMIVRSVRKITLINIYRPKKTKFQNI